MVDKPTWREWMDIFVDNKFVSKVKVDPSIDQSNAIPDDEDEIIDIFEETGVTNLEDILDQMMYDRAYEDMLQYLSVSGMFNLSFGEFQEWNDINKLA